MLALCHRVQHAVQQVRVDAVARRLEHKGAVVQEVVRGAQVQGARLAYVRPPIMWGGDPFITTARDDGTTPQSVHGVELMRAKRRIHSKQRAHTSLCDAEQQGARQGRLSEQVGRWFKHRARVHYSRQCTKRSRSNDHARSMSQWYPTFRCHCPRAPPLHSPVPLGWRPPRLSTHVDHTRLGWLGALREKEARSSVWRYRPRVASRVGPSTGRHATSGSRRRAAAARSVADPTYPSPRSRSG